MKSFCTSEFYWQTDIPEERQKEIIDFLFVDSRTATNG